MRFASFHPPTVVECAMVEQGFIVGLNKFAVVEHVRHRAAAGSASGS